MGYRFCMDQIVDLDFDAETLAEFGFHFVKVEAGRSCRRKGATPAKPPTASKD